MEEQSEWEEKIRKDYKGIVSEGQIEATIKYWRNFIDKEKEESYEQAKKDWIIWKVPIGVSNWIEYGKKYNYDKYLQDRFYKEGRINGEEEILKNVGFLRQLLNEDRITDSNKMITNEYIINVLKQK